MKLDLQANDLEFFALINRKGNISLLDGEGDEDGAFYWKIPLNDAGTKIWKGGKKNHCIDCKKLTSFKQTMGLKLFPYLDLIIPKDYQQLLFDDSN